MMGTLVVKMLTLVKVNIVFAKKFFLLSFFYLKRIHENLQTLKKKKKSLSYSKSIAINFKPARKALDSWARCILIKIYTT